MPSFLGQLKRQLTAYGRDPNSYDAREVVDLETTALPGARAVRYRATVNGDGDQYSTYVQFFNVSFNSARGGANTELVNVSGATSYHAKPSIARNPVTLKCSCQDFRFNFEKQLFDVQSLIGNWRRYKRRTPPPTRPDQPKNPNPIGHDFVNPDDYLGYCKHVRSLLLTLKRTRRITE